MADQDVERVGTFLQRRATSVTIKVSDDSQAFSGDARVVDLETCNFQFPIADLEAVSRLIERCATLTDLTFQPGATDVVLENLHTFQVLDLTLNGPLEAAIGGLLTGNPTLKSCTLRIRPSETVLRAILTPFMFHRVSEKEKALVKKLVLVNAAPNPKPPNLDHVVTQVIQNNTLLEHLEVGDDVVEDSVKVTSLKANAIRLSKSLKVLRLQSTVAEFKEIVAVGGLIPCDRTPNTTLSTLRVSLRDFVSVTASGGVVENYAWVADLEKLVESTRTLEHVEVSHDSAFKLLERYPEQAAALKSKLRKELQRVCAARPKQSTSSSSTSTSASSTETRELRSVSVGWWKAVLEGDQWQITYTGPGKN